MTKGGCDHMVGKIDHIAIAVDDLDDAIRLYGVMFDLSVTHREHVKEYHVEIATISTGNTSIELIAATHESSPIHKFVTARGPGLHHIGFVVENITEELDAMRSKGATLIDASPRRGKDNSLVAFVHPRSTGKVLVELVQLDDKK